MFCHGSPQIQEQIVHLFPSLYYAIVPNRTQLPPLDGELFLAKLEQAEAEGHADFVEANMPRLERMIAVYQESAKGLPDPRGNDSLCDVTGTRRTECRKR